MRRAPLLSFPGLQRRLTPVVVPAQAGTHIPEAMVWGTMGPRFRGDDSRGYREIVTHPTVPGKAAADIMADPDQRSARQGAATA